LCGGDARRIGRLDIIWGGWRWAWKKPLSLCGAKRETCAAIRLRWSWIAWCGPAKYGGGVKMSDSRIICGDCVEVLGTLADNSVSLAGRNKRNDQKFVGPHCNHELAIPLANGRP